MVSDFGLLELLVQIQLLPLHPCYALRLYLLRQQLVHNGFIQLMQVFKPAFVLQRHLEMGLHSLDKAEGGVRR